MAAKKVATTNQNKASQYDYTGFPKDVQTSLHKRVDNLKQLGNTATQTFLEIGKELAAAREEIQPFRDGGFQEWVHVELGITEQYAYQLINVYEQFGKDASKLNLLAGLSNTVLREISAPSVPQEARDTVVAKAQAGEKVSVAQAKDIVKQAKQPQVDSVGNEAANIPS